MIDIDLKSLSFAELSELKDRAEQELDAARERDRKKVLKKLEKVAAEAGFTLAELVKKPTQKRTYKPKYRNPENAQETWTGMGNKPKWVRSFIEGGGDLETIRITD